MKCKNNTRTGSQSINQVAPYLTLTKMYEDHRTEQETDRIREIEQESDLEIAYAKSQPHPPMERVAQ